MILPIYFLKTPAGSTYVQITAISIKMSIYPPLRLISISVDIDVFCTYPCRYRPIISAAGSYQIYEVNCISPGGSLYSQITYTISIFLNINIHAIYRLLFLKPHNTSVSRTHNGLELLQRLGSLRVLVRSDSQHCMRGRCPAPVSSSFRGPGAGCGASCHATQSKEQQRSGRRRRP